MAVVCGERCGCWSSKALSWDWASRGSRLPATPGYSGKNLADKIGLRPSMRVRLVRGPAAVAEWLRPLPAGVTLVTRGNGSVECAMVFATAEAELRRDIPGIFARISDGGMCWFCWPKKSSGVVTDVTEDLLRELILPHGWVDVKVCAVSEVWSGLKFLRRKS